MTVKVTKPLKNNSALSALTVKKLGKMDNGTGVQGEYDRKDKALIGGKIRYLRKGKRQLGQYCKEVF